MSEHADSRSSWVREPAGEAQETIYNCWLFQLRKQRYRSRSSGIAHDFYVVDLADGVHVIAVTPGRQVIMVRQFRGGAGQDSLETPGGLLEPGEDPLEAGARELFEETGYSGDPPRLISVLRPNPALLTMRISTIVIENACKRGEPQPDPGEELAVELVPQKEIPKLIASGAINHAVCVAGLLQWLAESSAPGRS